MPAAALNLKIGAEILGSVEFANDLANAKQALDVKNFISFALGTLANQCDLIFSDTRTLAASATENLDLNGTLTDASGAVINMVDLCAVIVFADAGNTNDVVVGGAASNAVAGLFSGTTPAAIVKPGGMFMLVAPKDPAYAVVATTADLLKVANSAAGSSVSYTVILLGRSA